MKKIKHSIIAFLIAVSLVSVIPVVTNAAPTPLTTFAACTSGRILTFPTWYKNLPINTTNCAPMIDDPKDLWIIILNVIEMMMQAAGYLAAGYMTWGGFKYIKSQGNPQNIASAKSTLMNAGIGLGVALSAVAVINFIGTTIK
jgi:hypothetical protein